MKRKRKVLRLPSFAKINLGLEIRGKREDGYHEVRTLFQTVDLMDTLEFALTSSGVINLQGDDPTVPWDEKNLIYRAACLLGERFSVPAGVNIKVQKRIPAGSGLGGGSSNAAVTLLALNRLWELRLDLEALTEIARTLGSDVAYFLTGGLCLGEGRGDIITPLPELPPLPCVIALPSFPISTAEIYQRYDELHSLTKTPRAGRIKEFLERRRLAHLENELETTVFEAYPGLREVKSLLVEAEAVVSLVSGTGSSIFGLFWEKESASRAAKVVSSRAKAVLTETLPRERYRQFLA